MTVTAGPRTRFSLPADLTATEPPEARGLTRDGVRLLVADGAGGVQHARFRDLPRFLTPGDVLVVNTSATVPGAVDGRRGDGGRVTVHFSTPLDDHVWVVELRRADGTGPIRDASAGERVTLPDGVTLALRAGFPDPAVETGSRLWVADAGVEGGVMAYLGRRGRPIAYGYLHDRWPLQSYQTVFARHPGSAEMPSAGRPFTSDLVTDLVTSGVVVTPVVLHCGVSSLEAHEPPPAERFAVPRHTADLVTDARRRGSRVVAVGTTVVRALETVAGTDGSVRPGEGWTDLVLGPDRPPRVVDGLVTGFHEPEASHLLLLEAVVGADVVRRAYDAALEQRYLWHEFGDSALLFGQGG